MSSMNLWKTEYAIKNCTYYTSLEELLSSDKKITSFVVKDIFDPSDEPEIIIDRIGKKNNLKIIYTDSTHPILHNSLTGYIVSFMKKKKTNNEYLN